MKRIARKPTLLSKTKLKSVNRHHDTVQKSSGNNFYNIIEGMNGHARVCVLRGLGGIGDILMITPALRELKRRYPQLHLSFAIDMHKTSNNVYYALVENAPFIDKIIDARYVNRKDYDAYIDISSVCIRFERKELPNINRIDLFARSMGLNGMVDKVPFYQVKQEEKLFAKVFLKEHVSRKLIVLHTASFEEKRSWPIEHQIALIEMCKDLNITFLVLDFNQKYSHWDQHSNVVNCSHTNLREMAALINEADLFIGPDSGPMHLAGALQKRSLVLFGSIPPEARINYYRNHAAIKHPNLSCLGCWYNACPYNIKCMKELQTDLVYNRINQLLG